MKKISILLLFVVQSAIADGYGFKQCEAWDTFCKSPPQIVATKCRLGVPVYADTCEKVGVKNPYTVFRKSLVPGLPVSEINTGRSTNEIIEQWF